MANQWDRERFIKVFLHESMTWKALSYDARSLYLHLQRAAGRQASVALGKFGLRGLANVFGARLDVIQPAMDELIEAELVMMQDGLLMLPEHAEQQSSSWNETARKQDQRERKREGHVPAMSQPCPEHVPGTSGARDKITRARPSHVPAMSQDVPSMSTKEREIERQRETEERQTEREKLDPSQPVASSRAHARAQASEAPPQPAEAPQPQPAQKAGGQAGDLEAELRKLLEADRYYQGLTGTNAQELAQRLAFHADAKKPAHVIAAVRRALDLAAASSYNAATTNKSILAFAQRASEADMAQSLPARTGRPGLAAAEPRPITTKTVGIVPDTLTEEERQRTEEMFRFRKACGWTPLQPWPLPAMVAAGWAEGMPWPLPSQSGDKASPRPLSGPATAKAVASEAS